MQRKPQGAFFTDLPPRHAATLSTALRLFAGKGFFSTSIHDIAAQAEVSIGFIYHNFGDKEGIARALHRELLEHLAEQVNTIGETHRGAERRCRAIAQLLFELTESAPQVMDFIIHARHKEFLPDEKPICSSAPFVRMQEFVYEGMAKGEVRPMPPIHAAAIVYGATIRMISLRLDGVLESSLDAHFEEFWSSAWRALEP